MESYEVFDSKPEELYFRVGAGIVKLTNLQEIMAGSRGKKNGWLSLWFKSRDDKKDKDYIIKDDNSGEHRYVIASCCNPIPGDSVVGFLASDGSVTLHKRSCHTADRLASKFGDKIVIPKWEYAQSQNLSFLVRLSLKGFDRIGIINDITRYISFVMSVNIRSFSLSTEDGIFSGHIDLYVHEMGDLEKLMKKLRKIEGIQSVVRTDL